MGQVFPSDSRTQLTHHPPSLNAKQAISYYPLSICPAIKVPYHSIISKTYTEETIEVIVKFFMKKHVCLKLTRKPA